MTVGHVALRSSLTWLLQRGHRHTHRRGALALGPARSGVAASSTPIDHRHRRPRADRHRQHDPDLGARTGVGARDSGRWPLSPGVLEVSRGRSSATGSFTCRQASSSRRCWRCARTAPGTSPGHTSRGGCGAARRCPRRRFSSAASSGSWAELSGGVVRYESREGQMSGVLYNADDVERAAIGINALHPSGRAGRGRPRTIAPSRAATLDGEVTLSFGRLSAGDRSGGARGDSVARQRGHGPNIARDAARCEEGEQGA